MAMALFNEAVRLYHTLGCFHRKLLSDGAASHKASLDGVNRLLEALDAEFEVKPRHQKATPRPAPYVSGTSLALQQAKA